MSWLVFFLGLLLTGGGGYGLYASLDLLGTDTGSLYGTCGAIGVAGGVVTLAIGALIRRVDALRPPLVALSHAAALGASAAPGEAIAYTSPLGEAVTLGQARRAPDSDDATSKFAPTQGAEAPAAEPPGAPIEASAATEAAATPAGPSTLVGRYSAGGASYKIFSDGSIEADTDQGAFRFASMTDFKAFIAAKRPTSEPPSTEPPPVEA